jgi:predicted nucleotidyltransferase component of viral defense system
MSEAPIDFQSIRRAAITALFSDDVLFEKIVLKGGNALNLALKMSDRTSLDLDFSIENDFEDLEDIQNRVSAALERRFGSFGYRVFDFKSRGNLAWHQWELVQNGAGTSFCSS